jgi:hypothetical protein
MRVLAASLGLLIVLMLGARGEARPPLASEVTPTVSLCELIQDKARFDRKRLRINAFVTYGFENFQLADPDCDRDANVWLTYGGTARSGAVYCCPGEGGTKERRENVRIEGIEVPLRRDAMLEDFRKLLSETHDTTVYVTLTGWFFTGRKNEAGRVDSLAGYGHLGCCSLFVIEGVEDFEPHHDPHLDYSAEAGWYEEGSCQSSSMRYLRHVSLHDPAQTLRAIRQLEAAEQGDRAWAYDEPERVAHEAFVLFYPHEEPAVTLLRKGDARQVYQWKKGYKRVLAVVTRPYWLGFYTDRGAVPWVATHIKEIDCS